MLETMNEKESDQYNNLNFRPYFHDFSYIIVPPSKFIKQVTFYYFLATY